ncbi:DUF6276 family protein [Salinirubrum litoreum]|uniref:DUF6276 family protein n=1 Tax=Salinirubrum litoreum TaxID=1126234 RepID=A0ABD5RDG2_9EURY|nr:DUF6276 family protein [Salinirubrum litoreum]
MTCPDCADDRVVLAVPDDYREFAPEESPRVSVCRTCLRVRPAPVDAGSDDSGDGSEDPTALGDWTPAGDAGVGVVLLVGLLDSLALNRSRIETLVARIERDGADPLLALDRLADAAATGAVEPHVDLARRRPQLQQFLDT